MVGDVNFNNENNKLDFVKVFRIWLCSNVTRGQVTALAVAEERSGG